MEIEPGTAMNIWVPTTTKKKGKEKPAVVLVHGFAAEGIVTWQCQAIPLASKYAVYVPDLLFFGDSVTGSSDRSPAFQAECLAKALNKLGVQSCTVVGFSYGGMVAFKMAEIHPRLVSALVISGSVLAMTDSISDSSFKSLGFSSSSELLLPNSVKGLKALLSISSYKKFWFPNFIYRDYLEVMFTNRKERSELLEALRSTNEESSIPHFPQSILLLWGEKDQVFNIELAKNMKEQLGDKVMLQAIKKAGHLVHIERPFVYKRCLKRFLALSTSIANGSQG